MTLVEGSTDIGGTRTEHRHAAGRDAGHRAPRTSTRRSAIPTRVGYTFLTGGSRVTFATGLAAYKLGLDLQEQMKQRAAGDLGMRRRPRSK